MARPAQNSRFNFVQIDGEALLYDNETHNVVYLDQPGAVVWALCDGERDEDAIIRLIADAYPESGAAIATDVRQTIARLVEHGALSLR